MPRGDQGTHLLTAGFEEGRFDRPHAEQFSFPKRHTVLIPAPVNFPLNLFQQPLLLGLIFSFGQGTRVEQGFEPLKVIRLDWFGVGDGPP
jgi:hypothetical protein